MSQPVIQYDLRLHVDADEKLMTGFYKQCGFEATIAGLVNLTK